MGPTQPKLVLEGPRLPFWPKCTAPAARPAVPLASLRSRLGPLPHPASRASRSTRGYKTYLPHTHFIARVCNEPGTEQSALHELFPYFSHSLSSWVISLVPLFKCSQKQWVCFRTLRPTQDAPAALLPSTGLCRSDSGSCGGPAPRSPTCGNARLAVVTQHVAPGTGTHHGVLLLAAELVALPVIQAAELSSGCRRSMLALRTGWGN